MTQERAFGLSSTTLEKLNSVFAQHAAIDSVLIYGSRAKGNYRPGSDIDLTIKGGGISFAEFLQIEDQNKQPRGKTTGLFIFCFFATLMNVIVSQSSASFSTEIFHC